MKKIIRRLKIYWWPALFLILIIEFCVILLGYYRLASPESEKITNLGVQASLMLLTTFAGIFTPLWIQKIWQDNDERTRLKLSLHFISDELRKNSHILEQIRANYEFKKILEIPRFKDMVPTIYSMFGSIHTQTDYLSNDSFLSAQNSGSLVGLRDDDCINAVSAAYSNMISYKVVIGTILEDLKLKMYLCKQTFDPLTEDESVSHRYRIVSELLNGLKELDLAHKSSELAVKIVDAKLKVLGINTVLEPRKLPEILELP